MKEIILDTGPISLILAKETKGNLPKIENLFRNIETQEIKGYIVTPVLAEVFKILCYDEGKSFAQHAIISLINNYPVKIMPLVQTISMKAGYLKCRYRNELSYVDSFVLAFALINNCEVHTTENFPNPKQLRIVKYTF